MVASRGRLALSTAVLFLFAVPASAQDKSQYWLFRPTPEKQMRDMTTDRPDNTESPFTVDAGHIQFETNIFGFSRSRPDYEGTFTKSYDYGSTNIRVGLTNSTEFNVIVHPYGMVRTTQFDPEENVINKTRQSGSGGVDLRLKVNLWGNDTFEKPGATAFALLPFVTIPTGWENGISPPGIEGGLVIPFAIKLTEKWNLGISGGFHVVRNDIEEPSIRPGTHTEWFASGSLAYEWTEKFGTYYEIVGRFRTLDARGDIGLLSTGFTYRLAKNVQLDGGINIGLTRAADRINPFVGISARF